MELELSPPTQQPEVQQRLAAAYQAQPRRSIVLTELMAPANATALRAAIDPLVKPLDHPDRGAYDFADVAKAEVEPLRALASAIVGRALGVAAARVVRFSHRSYQLSGDDHYDLHDFGVFDKLHIELTMDFSATITGEGDLVYQDRASTPVIVMPQLPCSALVLEREPAERMLYRYVRYLPMSVGDQRIHKLRVVLI